MHSWKWSWLGLIAVGLVAVGCGTDSGGSAGTAGSGGAGGDGGAGGTVPAPALGCDPVTPSYCGFPYPNDYWTIEDATTATGKRLALPEAIMPENDEGIRADVTAFNEADGFSPGIAAMTHLPGATITGLATPDTIESSLDPDSPTVIIDAETGQRVAHWVDLDEYVVQAKIRVDADAGAPDFTIDRSLDDLRQEQALMLRPAIRLDDSTRYIVAIRGVLDASNAPLPAEGGFQELRDDVPSNDPVIESRRTHFEDIFTQLEGAGVNRSDLQIAWDFTTASKANNTDWMVHIRDDAFANFPDGVTYTVEAIDEGIDEGIACRLEITFDMPLYMTGGGAGTTLNFGSDGLPTQNGTFEYAAAMVVPESAQPPGEAAALVEFGHGQLGTKEQVLGFQEIAAQLNLAAFGLDFKGFSSEDQATIIIALGGDWSDFRAIPERMHQGFLNFLMAMRTLSREAGGGPMTELNQYLAAECGGAVIDGDKRYYFGGSQGGILGASLMALSTDIERGVIAVPGQSYNLLLNRSRNVDAFAPLMYGPYDWNALHLQMNLALIQGLWDRAEPTGYSKYIRTERFPGTPAHEVLIQVSKSDHQVTNLGAHIMARTIGGVVNLAADDDVANVIRPVWGLDVVTGAHTGSGMIEVDFGNPEAPIGNFPPWDDTMDDPHGRATELAALGPVLSTFYETGVIENPCSGPCDADDL